MLKVRTLFEKLNTLKSGIETGGMAVQNHAALPVVDQLIDQIDSVLNLAPDPQQEPQTAQPDPAAEQQAMLEQQMQQEQEQQALMQQQEQEMMQQQQMQQEPQPDPNDPAMQDMQQQPV